MVAELLGAILQVTGAMAAPTEQEIVVTAKRLDDARYALRIHRETRAVQCWITRTSGDPRIDWQVCEIAKVCATAVPLKRKIVQQCMRDRRAEFIRTYKPAAE
jgi:hypothetical protein